MKIGVTDKDGRYRQRVIASRRKLGKTDREIANYMHGWDQVGRKTKQDNGSEEK